MRGGRERERQGESERENLWHIVMRKSPIDPINSLACVCERECPS